jgi:hypothetical protein
VLARGESEESDRIVGVVPGSVKQARRIAADYLREHPNEELLIKRGAKVLDRVEVTNIIPVHPAEAA